MKKILSAFGIAVLCAACQQVPPPVDVYADENRTANINHVEFKQCALENFRANTVMIKDMRRSKTNDGYQRVQVFVKNLTKEDVRVSYRFNWEDESGVEIEDLDHSTWERKTVRRGDEPEAFTSIAPKQNCHDFRFRIKPVDKKHKNSE